MSHRRSRRLVYLQPVSVALHGTSQHDATVSKKRVIYIPVALDAWGANTTSTSYVAWGDYYATQLNVAEFDLITWYFQCMLKQTAAGTFTCYAQLYCNDAGAAVAGSEVSAALSQWGETRLRSSEITLTGNKSYRVQQKVQSGGTYSANHAFIVGVQSG